LKTIIVSGDIYFITITVVGHTKIFAEDKYCQIIIDNFKFYRKKHNFKLFGFVVMPDHLHLLIFPKVDSEEPTSTPLVDAGSLEPAKRPFVKVGFSKPTISDIMRDFKKYTAVQIIKQLKVDGREDVLQFFHYYAQKHHSNRNRHYQVWLDRFWSTNIYSDKFFHQKLNYLHNNPIRAGLVKKLDDYLWSSYQNYYLNNHSLIKIDFWEG